MARTKDMNLITETNIKESKGILPNEQKGKYIKYSVDELKALSKKPLDFATLIKSEGWLKLLYTGDWTHNERLNFVRMWFYREYRGIVPEHLKMKKEHEKGQQQLPLL